MSYIPFNKKNKKYFEEFLKNRLIMSKAYESYNGPAGLYDFGPLGTAIKNNLIDQWRKIFTRNAFSHEIDAPLIAPYKVMESSGHVQKFCDLLISDMKTGESFRADHLIGSEIENMEMHEIYAYIKNNNIKSPVGNELGNLKEFNLMFKTNIGVERNNVGFLRPETAQSQFLYFPLLFNQIGTLPFASFSIGKSFRNEISPRNKTRLREFEQAEIEFFCSPTYDDHPLFSDIENFTVNLLIDGDIIKEQLCSDKYIKSKIIRAYVGLTQRFFIRLGLHEQSIRFRQHAACEMAHYANDCWDAEVYTEHGWLEVAGVADRGVYDLTGHSKYYNMKAHVDIPPHLATKYFKVKSSFNKTQFKSLVNKKQFIAKIEEERIELERLINDKRAEPVSVQKKIKLDEEELDADFFISEHLKTTEEFIPRVIEPSYGISRIFYTVIEQQFRKRGVDLPECKCSPIKIAEDEKYYFSLNKYTAPFLCALSFLRISMSKDRQFLDLKRRIESSLEEYNIYYIERNMSIGKKYVMADEMGILLFITIDEESIKTGRVTVRCRECTQQTYVELEGLTKYIYEFLQ